MTISGGFYESSNAFHSFFDVYRSVKPMTQDMVTGRPVGGCLFMISLESLEYSMWIFWG